MNKLLKSELSRLFRNKYFIISFIVITALRLSREDYYIDATPTDELIMYAGYSTLFTILFVGSLFRNRTAINILSSGVKKTELYCSEFVISAVISLAFTLPSLLFFITRKFISTPSGVDYYKSFLSGSEHSGNIISMILTLYFLSFILTVLMGFIGVSLVMIFRSDIKALIAFALLIPLQIFLPLQGDEFAPKLEELPYYLSDGAIDYLLEAEKLDIDPFDSASLEKIPELSNLPKNPKYISGIKRTAMLALKEAFPITHISRISRTTVNLKYDEMKVTAEIRFEGYYNEDMHEWLYIYFDAKPETPIEILKIFHMEYCIAAVALLNIFALAVFRKSNLS